MKKSFTESTRFRQAAKADSMRILQVSNGYPPRAYGGVETHTQRLSRVLQGHGHSVRIFTRHSDPEAHDGDVLAEVVDGLAVTSVVNDARGGDFRDHFLSTGVAEAFRREIENIRPDIVHFQHLIGLSADLPMIASDAGVRCVATVHEYWYACHRVMLQRADLTPCAGPLHRDCVACVSGEAASREERTTASGDRRRWLPRFLRQEPTTAAGPPVADQRFQMLRGALDTYDRIATPSQFVIDELQRHGMLLPKASTKAIALGLPRPTTPATAPRTTPISATHPLRITFIGHLLPHKGPHVLLAALQQLKDLPIQLELHGRRWEQHPYETMLGPLLREEPRAKAYGTFADEDLPEILARTDALVVPSTCPESFGLATREAMLAGRPVVSSNRGALPESIRNEQDGLLVPGEDAEALAVALRRLVEEEGLLTRLSQGVRRASIATMETYAVAIERFLYS
jgi:glycosyltransferase involved in cell wall biosynthesis